MSLSIESKVELIKNIAVFLAVVLLFVYGGWGLILRIVLAPLKIKVSGRIFKRLDDHLLDLQLIRLHHGINVKNKDDAALVFQAISSGVLSRSDFMLLGFAPPIGLKKSNVADAWLSGLTVIGCFCIVFAAGTSLMESKYDHAVYSQGNEIVLVSQSDIYTPKSKKYLLKTDCKKIDSKEKSILASACDYLLTEDKDKKEELAWAINRNNKAMISLTIMTFIIAAFGMLALILSISYYMTNNKFYEFKVRSGAAT